MRFTEEPVSFACTHDALVGILTRPCNPRQTGVVVIVGGPQYRVGSHRQFVLLSRALAGSGYAVLRFDVRGMGDSEGEPLDFAQSGSDIALAIAEIQRCVPEIEHVALWGLCDGASAALLYTLTERDQRVTALCLVNPWVRSETSQASARIKYYYVQRLLTAGFWAKLLRGRVKPQALMELSRSVWLSLIGQRKSPSESSFQQQMAVAWHGFSGRIFLLLSGDDYIAKEFLEHAARDHCWKNAFQHPSLVRHDEPTADHTFSSAALRERVANLTLQHCLQHPNDRI
jgi:exosortase A-associated hydrolase 1